MIRRGHWAAAAWAWRGVVLVSAALAAAAAPVTASAQAAPPVPTFEEAYQREGALLRAERDALQAELELARQNGEAQRREQTTEIERITAEIHALRAEVEQLGDEIDAMQAQALAGDDHAALFEATLDLARERLEERGREIGTAGTTADRLDAVVRAGIEEVRLDATIHTEEGSFYAPDGELVQGTVVRVGRVAALGAAPGAAGVLGWAPGGGLQVVDDGGSADAARRLAAGEQVGDIPLALLDPDGASSDRKTRRGLRAVARDGGPIAWIILVLGALGLGMVAERSIALLRRSNLHLERLPQVHQAVRDGDLARAAERCRGMGALSDVLLAVLSSPGGSREELETRAGEAVLRALPGLERSQWMLNVIVAASPLLGLLGTVTGMISTFDVISQVGTGDPEMLSGGISVALITTQLGLAVAVPLLLLKSATARWSARLRGAMQIEALALVRELRPREDRRG